MIIFNLWADLRGSQRLMGESESQGSSLGQFNVNGIKLRQPDIPSSLHHQWGWKSFAKAFTRQKILINFVFRMLYAYIFMLPIPLLSDIFYLYICEFIKFGPVLIWKLHIIFRKFAYLLLSKSSFWFTHSFIYSFSK